MSSAPRPLSVFEFSKFSLFLKDIYAYKKAQYPGMSYESWALELGYKSRSYVKMILDAKRPASYDFVERLCKAEGFVEKEKIYLRALVSSEFASEQAEMQTFQDKLIELRGKEKDLCESLSKEKFLQDPQLPQLHMLIGLKGNHRGSVKLSQLMGWDLEKTEFYLESLAKMGVAEKVGIHWTTSVTSFRIPEKLGDQVLRKYQEASALESMKAQDIERNLRKFRSLLFTASESDLDVLNEEVNRFVSRVLERFDSSSLNNKRLFKLNLNFYPLTPLIEDKETP